MLSSHVEDSVDSLAKSNEKKSSALKTQIEEHVERLENEIETPDEAKGNITMHIQDFVDTLTNATKAKGEACMAKIDKDVSVLANAHVDGFQGNIF